MEERELYAYVELYRYILAREFVLYVVRRPDESGFVVRLRGCFIFWKDEYWDEVSCCWQTDLLATRSACQSQKLHRTAMSPFRDDSLPI